MMQRQRRNAELNRECRKQHTDKVDEAEDYEQRRRNFPHEVRCVEEMQDLERSEPYGEVRREDAKDVDAADLHNLLT